MVKSGLLPGIEIAGNADELEEYEDRDTHRWIDRFPPNNKPITGLGAVRRAEPNEAKQRANDAWDIHVMTYSTATVLVCGRDAGMVHPACTGPTLVNGFTYSRVVRARTSISLFASARADRPRSRTHTHTYTRGQRACCIIPAIVQPRGGDKFYAQPRTTNSTNNTTHLGD